MTDRENAERIARDLGIPAEKVHVNGDAVAVQLSEEEIQGLDPEARKRLEEASEGTAAKVSERIDAAIRDFPEAVRRGAIPRMGDDGKAQALRLAVEVMQTHRLLHFAATRGEESERAQLAEHLAERIALLSASLIGALAELQRLTSPDRDRGFGQYL